MSSSGRGEALGIELGGYGYTGSNLDPAALEAFNVVRMTRLVTPVMQDQGRGSIVNISTFAAFEPDPDFPTSAVFRAGLADFAKLYANRYAAMAL